MPDYRKHALKQQPAIAWLTGLSGAGKSTIAYIVERKLIQAGRRTMVLDGDNLRLGLNSDLGFSDGDRSENVRRVAEVAHLMAEAGLVTIVATISPFCADRAAARSIAGDVPFLEVFLNASLEICEARDPKGLYAKARAGYINNFTGISSPYEAPENPDLTICTDRISAYTSAKRLFQKVLSVTGLESSNPT